MPISQLLDPGDAPLQPGQFLDWAVGLGGQAMNSRRFVHNRPDLYAVPPVVLINSTGRPTVRLRYCSQDDYDTNLWQGDCILVARDTNSSTEPLTTPITLSFPDPLEAVGAYVTVAGAPEITDMPFDAVMWVQEADSDTWLPVHGQGTVGHVLQGGADATAAFVGATATDHGRIRKVCFDATLAGSFETLALSRLYWAD